MTDNYTPLTAGEAVVGKINIKDDGTFDGEFNPRYLSPMRELVKGTMVEVVVVAKAGIPLDYQRWQTQFDQFLKDMAAHQRGEPYEAYVPAYVVQSACFAADQVAMGFLGTPAAKTQAVLQRALEALVANGLISVVAEEEWPFVFAPFPPYKNILTNEKADGPATA